MTSPDNSDEELIARGLACLSRIDRFMWGGTVERRLRDPESNIRLYLPKDGVEASTLSVVSRFWMAWISGGSLLIGIALLSIPSSHVLFRAIGWPLVGLGVMAFGVGLLRITQAIRARRAWKRSSES